MPGETNGGGALTFSELTICSSLPLWPKKKKIQKEGPALLFGLKVVLLGLQNQNLRQANFHIEDFSLDRPKLLNGIMLQAEP